MGMGLLSTSHMLIIGIVVLLLFGNRLPSTMRSLGEGISEFKKGLAEVGDDTHKEASRTASITADDSTTK